MKLFVLPLWGQQALSIDDYAGYFRGPVKVRLLFMISKARGVNYLFDLPDNLPWNTLARQSYIINIDS
ncbi:hypothetical protein SE91_00495 [Bradyrhizobium sp. DOA1]|nr:hypothetical protein SE91_00495 [Bradyrhizobium sp. DOA1]